MKKLKTQKKPKNIKLDFSLEEFKEFYETINNINHQINYSNEIKDPWTNYDGTISLTISKDSIFYKIKTLTENEINEELSFEIPLTKLCT